MIAFAPQKLTQGMFLITSLCLMCPFYLLYFYLPLFRDHKNFKTFWLLINDRYHLDLCKNVFGEGIYPDVAATNIYYGGTKIAGINIDFSPVYIFFLKISRKHGYLILAAMSISDMYPIWIPWSISLTFFISSPLSLTFSLWN